MLAAVAATVGASSCSKETRCITGKGDRVSRDYEVADFKHVHLSGSDYLEIRKGEVYELRIEAQDNIHDRIEVEVSGEELEVDLKHCVMSHKEIRIFVTTPVLEDISVSGSGDVVVKDEFENESARLSVSGSGSIEHRVSTDELRVEISGSGEVLISGYADEQDVRISGSGEYLAFPLESRLCDIRVSGSGDGEIFVTEYLKAEISGSGDIRYRGNPSMHISVSGSGDIEKVD